MQLKLLPGLMEPSSDVSEYSLPQKMERMTVNLYDVSSVLVGPGVPMDFLTCSWTSCPDCACTKRQLQTASDVTKLAINTTGDSGYHFDMVGVRKDRVFFITDHPESAIDQVNWSISG